MKWKVRWYRLREQNRNNGGSSIVTVIVIMAVVGMIAALLMSMSLVNFRTKNTNLGSKKNFYTAEMALEEIRQGLCDDVSAAAATAYEATVRQYNQLNPTERKEKFQTEFLQQIKNSIAYQPTTGSYDKAHLESFLDTNIVASGKRVEILEGNPMPAANVNEAEASVLLKHVTVTMYDEDGFVSRLQTDIKMSCPEINFSQNSQMPDLPVYALLADDCLEISQTKNCTIEGSAYVGKNPTVINSASLRVQPRQLPGESIRERSLLVSGSTIRVEKENHEAELNFDKMEVWAKNLEIDSSSLTAQDTALYLQNDLLLQNQFDVDAPLTARTKTKVKLAGELYGYGNSSTAAEGASVQSLEDAERDAVEENIRRNPENYDSSVLINNANCALDLSELTAMKICGNSYINVKETDIAGNTENIQMGESLSIRPNQAAYLIPPECVAPEMENGGINPIRGGMYAKLQEELKDQYGETQAADKLVELDVQTKKYGVSLRELGVTGYQLEAQQCNAVNDEDKTLYYLFMTFSSTERANAFFQKYCANTDTDRQKEIMDVYDGTAGKTQTAENVGIKLPLTMSAGSEKFYFNGNVIASGENSPVCVADSLAGIDAGTAAALKEEQIKYQDAFAALNTKLVKEYIHLGDGQNGTAREIGHSVYENLVNDMISPTDVNYSIAAGERVIFHRSVGEGTAVVANGDYTIDANTFSNLPGQPGADLAVVIAKGDIHVRHDFTGLLIAGGKIFVEENVTIQADSEKAAKALLGVSEKGKHAYEYLKAGESYMIAGDAGASADGYIAEHFNMQDFVVYENWSKQ